MTSPTDDEAATESALTWDGDEVQTARPSRRAKRKRADEQSASDSAGVAETEPAAVDGESNTSEPEGDHKADGMTNAELVTFGVFGGVYALFTVGWMIAGNRLSEIVGLMGVNQTAYTVAWFLAVAACPAWFVTSLMLASGKKAWVRIASLLGGALLLVPWPFVMMGALG